MTRHQSLFFLAATMAAASLMSCIAEWGGLTFTIVFKDARGLVSGDPVVYRGVKIGAVRSVDVANDGPARVSVLIQNMHREAVYREARFVIEEAGERGVRENGRQITIKDRRGERTRVEDGDVIEGSEAGLSEILRSLEDAGKNALDAAKRLAEKLTDCVEDACETPEAERLREDVDEFMRDADKAAREEWGKFKQKRLPALREKAERLREKWRREGKLEQAEKFWDDFTRWLEEIDSSAQRDD
ncbi:MAG: MCE family protein [Vicinamibacteria bacterium]|nr:MCE family protein [Vicinamibacteria bacterium]